MDFLDGLTIQNPRLICAVIETDDRDSDCSPLQYPRAVSPRHEDITGLGNPLQHFAVAPSSNSLCGKESSTRKFRVSDHLTSFFEPICDEVSSPWYSALVKLAEVVYILVAEFSSHEFIAEERWIADDVIGWWPLRLVRFAVGVVSENGVGMFDVGEFLEDGFAVFEDAVFVLPLEEADPDDDAGEFVGVELDFDAEELGGGDHVGDDERDVVLGGEVAGFEPEVEHAAEGEIEEVSGAAGGVEDADGGEFGDPGGEEGFRGGVVGEEGWAGSFRGTDLRGGGVCG